MPAFSILTRDPAVTVDVLGHGKLKRHEDRGPHERVESDDLLCHDVNVGRPIFFKIAVLIVLIAKSRDVVGKSVYPNVDYVTLVKRDGHAPLEART